MIKRVLNASAYWYIKWFKVEPSKSEPKTEKEMSKTGVALRFE